MFSYVILVFGVIPLLAACWQTPIPPKKPQQGGPEGFKFQTEQFADLRILRYQVPGFEDLAPKQKELIYYLYEAALSGRDIIWDQNCRFNLQVRRVVENIVQTCKLDPGTAEWQEFLTYTKRLWFSNGLHHHYSSLKLVPGFSEQYFARLVRASDPEEFPLREGQDVDGLIAELTPILFDPNIAAKKINLDPSGDQVKTSATNYYAPDLTQKEVERYYRAHSNPKETRPVSYGLNSRLIKSDGQIREQVWKVGGLYSPAIERIVFWLQKASQVAETREQRAALEKLVEYYQTGDLKKWDEYNILWVQDSHSSVDTINGFIEVYGDPLGKKGSYESVVSFRDAEATKRIAALSRNAQWFEDHSPILDRHKKKTVKGISAKVITVVVESGDSSPSTPIGINLPNANWIRKEYGSKSVNLGNIVHAYSESAKTSGVLEEFAYREVEIERAKQFDTLANNLQTDMHEVIGHASGQIEPGVGTPAETLKSFASTLEEARADLVALYYLMDPKLVEIGVMPSLEVGKAGYDGYMRNGTMVQLARLKPGEELEEAHMRNRQMICGWVYEKGRSENIIERKDRDGKSFFTINDYRKLRGLFGQLLRQVQRIKSSGDYEAGKALVEDYGVKVDSLLHKEVLERYAKLNRAPYGGFINPKLVPVKDASGKIIDIRIEYPEDFSQQMLDYAKNYSLLPTFN
ncbi:MAG: dihydrofolate reductase [Acidobacteriota bacterium]